MNLTLEDRAEVAKAVWPETLAACVMNRAALVYDVELGIGTPTLSRVERARIEEELKRRGART